MRSSFCESYCAPFSRLRSLFRCCLPSLVQTKDAPNPASIPNSSPNHNSSTTQVLIPDSGAVVASIDEKSSEVKVDTPSVEQVNRKSCLKKPNGEKKGNVKWMDLLGKELVEIKDYEPSDSDSLDEDDQNTACICSIQ